jgi:hypothetical protein
VFFDKFFWFEIFLLLLIPYPTRTLGFGGGTFTVDAINWIDNSGVNTPQTWTYPVIYRNSDIMTVAIFVRVYFLLDGLLCILPLNQLES